MLGCHQSRNNSCRNVSLSQYKATQHSGGPIIENKKKNVKLITQETGKKLPAGQMLHNVQVSENGHNTYTVAVQIRVTRSEWRSKVEGCDGRGGVRAVTGKKISKAGERQRDRERDPR